MRFIVIKILNKLIFCVCLYLTHTSVSVACSLYTEVANAAQLDAAIVCFNSESAGPGEYKVILTDNIVPYNAFTQIEKNSILI